MAVSTLNTSAKPNPKSGNKKVVVERFEKSPLEGFVQLPGGLAGPQMELLTPDGGLLHASLEDIKAVCFVRDLDSEQTWQRHRSFAVRPKTHGLWLRLLFRDGDSLEALAPNDLLGLEAEGFTVTPPDSGAQIQKIFVPRPALVGVEVLGVIGSPLRKPAKRGKPPKRAGLDEGQLKMFE